MRRFKAEGFGAASSSSPRRAHSLGVVGAMVLLAFAVPAFDEINKDWRTQADFAVTFLDRYGNIIGRRGILQDDTVQLEDLPDNLVKAVLATEDRRFFAHFGIDVFGTLRAIQENMRAGGVVQGGSSITQQLAKNLFLSNERTLQRKIKEAYLALWLEANLTKREILKLYLDRAYMGGGTFGVGAAAEFYFGKKVQDVDLAEMRAPRRAVQGADQIRAAHQPSRRARPRQRGFVQHGAGGLHDRGPGGRRAPPAGGRGGALADSPPPTISSTGRSSR